VGSAKACNVSLWSFAQGRTANSTLATENQKITRMVSGRLAVFGVTAATNTNSRQNQTVRRCRAEPLFILLA